jgi:hypothetical protein
MFQTADLNSKIVTILKDYGTVPLDFIAKRLGREKIEISQSVHDLEKRDVLEFRGDNVKLKSALKTFSR